MNVSVHVFISSRDDVFAAERLVLVKRFSRPTVLSIDDEWLLLVGSEQESRRRFVRAFAGVT